MAENNMLSTDISKTRASFSASFLKVVSFFFPPLLAPQLVFFFCQKQQGELTGDPNPDRREPVDPVVHRLAEG